MNGRLDKEEDRRTPSGIWTLVLLREGGNTAQGALPIPRLLCLAGPWAGLGGKGALTRTPLLPVSCPGSLPFLGTGARSRACLYLPSEMVHPVFKLQGPWVRTWPDPVSDPTSVASSPSDTEAAENGYEIIEKWKALRPGRGGGAGAGSLTSWVTWATHVARC